MCVMDTSNTCKPSTEQDKEEKVAEFIPSVNTPTEKTQYLSSTTHLHDFQLPHLVWGSAKLVQCAETNPMIKNKSTPVFKPCLEAKQCKRVSSARPVDKGLEVVREKRVKRREGLFSFSFSLRKEEIEEDFMRVTGMMPQRKMKVNKTFKSAEEKHKYLEHQKYVKQCFPGSWLSGIYHV